VARRHLTTTLLGLTMLSAGLSTSLAAGPALALSAAAAGAATSPPATSPPACTVAQLAMGTGTLFGASGGGLRFTVSLRNRGSAGCRLGAVRWAAVVVDPGTRPLATFSDPGAIQQPAVALRPGGRAGTVAVWTSWCQGPPARWGLELRPAGQSRALYVPVAGSVAPGSMGSVIPPVPDCRRGRPSALRLGTLGPVG
jgi:hypothetical protein